MCCWERLVALFHQQRSNENQELYTPIENCVSEFASSEDNCVVEMQPTNQKSVNLFSSMGMEPTGTQTNRNKAKGSTNESQFAAEEMDDALWSDDDLNIDFSDSSN